MNGKWHAETSEDILKELGTSENGLSKSEAKQRLEKFGANEIARGEETSVLKVFLDQFKDFLILILIVAAAISFFRSKLIKCVKSSSETDLERTWPTSSSTISQSKITVRPHKKRSHPTQLLTYFTYDKFSVNPLFQTLPTYLSASCSLSSCGVDFQAHSPIRGHCRTMVCARIGLNHCHAV
ncbi:hypothetical protein AKJ41_03160 [candidate division MSBL1 archaeon SCGC-AAA259O05]|uniref:Cation-transporting P-type ATPase N-terminal domain-containing protein n=1 Tax=candidate division MSBL1 archaeon SCGC-AAA259O05 TaxID=1698271 RepID=A0A133V3L0_9EURY|nr:hypothetical protein AKJ41_03160 [candidate division MSBL1 archaeon SCGC-AAA259O05]